VTYKPSDRLTAAGALNHPWLADAPATEPASPLLQAGTVADTLTTAVGTALTKSYETVSSAGGTISRSIEEVLPSGLVEEALSSSSKGALTEVRGVACAGGAAGWSARLHARGPAGGPGAPSSHGPPPGSPSHPPSPPPQAFLLQEFGEEKAPPAPPREARQTIVW
jgi:hypothetical protein